MILMTKECKTCLSTENPLDIEGHGTLRFSYKEFQSAMAIPLTSKVRRLFFDFAGAGYAVRVYQNPKLYNAK